MMTTAIIRTSLTTAPRKVDWREIETEVRFTAVAEDWKYSMNGMTTAPAVAASRRKNEGAREYPSGE